MARHVIRTNRRLSEVKRIIRDIPAILAGEKSDRFGIRRAFWSGFADSMYEDIEVGFDQKANLQADELGERWQDLSPYTKAYSRPAREHDLSTRERNNLRNYRTIGLLDFQQTKIWKGIFKRHRELRLSKGDAPAVAARRAAKKAWSIIKSRYGGRTRLEALGFRKLQVLKDKKNLSKSLRRGHFNGVEYKPYNRKQLFKIERDRLLLGTIDPKAARHHNGVSGRLPTRRLWSKNLSPWVRKANARGAKAAILQLTRSI